jgi:DNA-binding transcriptional ArsR family regulator
MWRPETDDDLADLHEALADRWRVKVVTVLCERGEMTHGQLMKHLGLTQAHTSQVLGYLRSRGFVYGQRRGRNVYYGLAYPVICEALQALHRAWLARRERPGRDEPPASPQPEV